jgi:hypothetical protein
MWPPRWWTFFCMIKTQYVHFTCLRDLLPHPSLFQFALSVKFLDLNLDSRVLWEPHLRWLHVRSQCSLSILEALSGSSWGRDWRVIFRLYHLLVCFKIDCGCFMYGFTVKPKWSILNPVHNTQFTLFTYSLSYDWQLLFQLLWESVCQIWTASTVLTEDFPMLLCCEVENSAPSPVTCFCQLL